MAFEGVQSTSEFGKGDYLMGVGRKSRALDEENDQYLDGVRQQREQAEQEKAQKDGLIAEQQAKIVSAQAQGAAG